MNKKILMAVFGPIQTDSRVIRSAETLHSAGFNITVLSCNSLDYHNDSFRSIDLKIKSSPYAIFIFWIKVWRWLKNHRDEIDLLYMHDYFMPLFGKYAAKKLKKKWVYDAHELLIFRKGKAENFRAKIFYYFEKVSIKNADLVISANYERHRIIKSIYKLNNATYVQNISTVNVPKFTGVKDNIIVYQGVITLARNLDLYILAQKMLYAQYNYKLCFIGGGHDLEKMKDLVSRLDGEDYITFTGRVTQSEMYKISSSAKIGIVSYSLEGLNNYYCAPNKIFEYASLGIPMVATSQPFICRIFAKYGIGETFKPNDVNSYVDTIDKVIKNYDSYIKNLKSFLEDYKPSNESERLIKYVSDLF